MVFLVLLISLFLSTLTSKLEDFKKVEGTFDHSEIIVYKEWRYKGKFRGHVLVDEPRLTLFFLDHKQTYTLSKDDYESFFEKIENKRNYGKNMTLYLRNMGNESMNPMQIEIDGKIILPLSYHKRISFYLTSGAIVLLIIGVILLFKYFRKYKNLYYTEDRILWNQGFLKKLVVAGKWIGF